MIQPRPSGHRAPVIERAERQRLEIVRNAWGMPVRTEHRRLRAVARIAIMAVALALAVWLGAVIGTLIVLWGAW